MKRLLRSLLILTLCLTIPVSSTCVFAQNTATTANTASSVDRSTMNEQTSATEHMPPKQTLTVAGSDIETVPADDIPIEQAPSSKNNNDPMTALLKFVVVWSVVYIFIKLVRKKIEQTHKPFM